MQFKFLSKINSPKDIRGYSNDELLELCKEIRSYTIDTITEIGGHLAPTLGVVELSVALHHVFDTPKDKLVWDVGHQGYAHKLLTGRFNDFKTIRRLNGLSGFLKRSESEYDVIGAGHASTSISAALGIAEARKQKKEDYRVAAIIGDGSMTGGLAFEGINNAGHLGKQFLVILNDNEMSISPNVGAISRYFTRLISNPLYNRVRNEFWDMTGKLPIARSKTRTLIKKVEESLKSFSSEGDYWKIELGSKEYSCEKLMLATGSNSKIWNLLKSSGHSIVEAVPSLFTFNIKDERIKDLPGIALDAEVEIPGAKLSSDGPLLITHWGFSGPAILKLSAWGARALNELQYKFSIKVNWVPGENELSIIETLKDLKQEHSKQQVYKRAQFDLPKRLWQSLVLASGISQDSKWADLNKQELSNLGVQLTAAEFKVIGKSTFKEEFVTAGGIDLKEVDFQTFESKLHPNLYFAGEILNIDAITGGFNFQNAWTGGFLAAKAMS